MQALENLSTQFSVSLEGLANVLRAGAGSTLFSAISAQTWLVLSLTAIAAILLAGLGLYGVRMLLGIPGALTVPGITLGKTVLGATALAGSVMLALEITSGSSLIPDDGKLVVSYITGLTAFVLFLTTTVRATRTLFLLILWGSISLFCARHAIEMALDTQDHRHHLYERVASRRAVPTFLASRLSEFEGQALDWKARLNWGAESRR